MLTLTKIWVSPVTGDTVTFAISGTQVSGAVGGNSTAPSTTNNATATAVVGSTVNLAETLGAGNLGVYFPSLACVANGNSLTVTNNSITMPNAPVTCTWTNQFLAFTLSLGISKSTGTPFANAGQQVSFTIVVTATGGNGSGSVLTDLPVAGFTPSSIACTGASGGAACPAAGNVTLANLQGAGITLSTLPDGGSLTFLLSGTFTLTSGSLVNTATATPPVGSPVQSDALITAISPLPPPTQPIPTLGEYALIALMLLLTVLGGAAARRMRR